ncbi:hypothetical protein JCM16303_005643 [Sporobolomyces ruberrimus]
MRGLRSRIRAAVDVPLFGTASHPRIPTLDTPPRSLSYSAAATSIRSAARRRIARIDDSRSTAVSQGDTETFGFQQGARPKTGSPFLVDSFGRGHDYLRISLTEKCNLRCQYCMPSTGVKLLPRDDLLTTDEIERVARIFVANGVRKIRLTGGEPTIRKDLVDVVGRLAALRPRPESIGMTSNGVTLRRHLPALVEAGLTHVNVSLDTLDPLKYELMTRRRGFEKVMESLEVAKQLRQTKGLRVKLNVVVMKGVNDMEVPAFVELGKAEDLVLRFIEYMPFEDNRWSQTKLVPSADLLSLIEATIGVPIDKLDDSPSDTTRAYRVRGYTGSFGFISSMTNHFCGTCSRLRVGADGGMKVCLFGPPALALRPLLRSLPSTPANDFLISKQIGEAVWGKKFAHDGLGGALGIHANGKMGSMVGIEVQAEHRTLEQVAPNPSRSKATDSQRQRWARHTSFGRFTSQAASRSTPPLLLYTRLFSTANPPSPIYQAAKLSHIDPQTGRASMVDVSPKPATLRSATAKGKIYLNEEAFSLIDFGDTSSTAAVSPTMRTKKGDVLSVSQLAGLMAAKQTSALIPLCHPLSLSHLSVSLVPSEEDHAIEIVCTATCDGKTGVEMEALVGVSVAGLTVWDMCKAVAGEEMTLGEIRVVEKTGGRSGDWQRAEG